MKKDILEIASEADCLIKRIAANKAAQQIDLGQWIFERLAIASGYRVLELCCGTGAQTMSLLSLVGDVGHVVALDLSQKALESLSEKIDANLASRITLIESNMDDFSSALENIGLPKTYFDLVFCGYGLYYSQDAIKLLTESKSWLKPEGAMVIVGPYGFNNESLFKILRQCDVNIPDYVIYTSQDFMHQVVVPWATINFRSIRIATLINPIRWTSWDEVVSYWQNSTFYDPMKLNTVKQVMREHFIRNTEFVNHKWIMMVLMSNEQQ